MRRPAATRLRRPWLLALSAAPLTAALLTAASVAAADWPQFRGPRRDGISPETGLLTAWPPGGPPVVWRVPLGEGYSGLSVADGRLFTLFAGRGDEWVVALDAASGRELWRHRLDERYVDGQGNGPRSTPTVSGGTVYAVGARGKLAALDAATGRVLWSRDLVAELGARPPTWGVSASPHVEGDLLMLDVGGKPGYSVVAFDRETGQVRWGSGNDIAGYSTPLPVTVGGQRLVLFFTGTKISALRSDDGRRVWEREWRTSYDVNAATPVLVPPDKVFIASGYGVGGALFRLSAEDGSVQVAELWSTRAMKNQFSTSVLVDGRLYGFDNRLLKCIDAGSGEERWLARGFGHGSLTYADGHLWVLGDRGRLALVEATPEEYREKASFQVFTGKTWTVPTISDGRLFVRDEKELVALDVGAGGGGGDRGGE